MDNTLVKPLEKRDNRVEEWSPSGRDRCDHEACPSQGYVRLTGITGELTFCVHHFDKILKVAEAKLRSFAFDIQDRRELLIENRLVDKD